jgi:hypothetical protein
MRLSRLLSVTVVIGVAAAATIFACGGDDHAKVDAPKVFMDGNKVFMDAPAAGANGLGQLCPFAAGGAGSACPAGDACVKLNGVGSATTGYCTPNCAGSNAVCITGYTGPAGGMPECALTVGSGSGVTGCAIVCTSPAQCPTGMGCVQAPGSGAPMICVPN